MTLYSTLGFAAAMIILAASPGPGVFATVARALASGFRSAFAVICGIVLGDVIFLLLATFGLSMIAQFLGDLFLIVKIIGGAYLIFLGIRIWIKDPEIVSSAGNPDKGPGWGNFVSGLLITLSNPKVILFYCGFLPTFLDLSVLTISDLVLIAGIVAAVLIGVLSTYAFLASRARKMFSDRKTTRRLNRTAGSVMVATGIVIATRS